jgi:class 3 adenylate cyclase
MGPVQWIGTVAGVIGILGALVTLTRYLTQLQLRLRLERAEGELKQVRERHAELEVRHKDLLREVATAKSLGTAALVKKTDIDTELRTAMETVDATASSILVPEPTPGLAVNPSNFIFLSIYGPAAPELRRSRVTINKGVAGYVFAEGRPYVALDTNEDTKFWDRVDKRSKFQTKDILCVPLRHEGRIVGVVQFLNKRGEQDFDSDDLRIVERFAASLSAKVAEFLRNPDNLQLLGINPERSAKEASILVCDITRSGLLFDAMNTSGAVDLINDYLERQCDVALGHGATVDKYLGDGVMLRFNVPRPLPDHPLAAVKTAIEMQKSFEALKAGWIDYGLPVSAIFNRIGVSSGPVHEVTLGHPQYQYITVMGSTVNLAHNLCEAGARDRNVVLIDRGIRQRLGDRVLAGPVSLELKGEPLHCFEVQGIP